jgi:hypothetical protein
MQVGICEFLKTVAALKRTRLKISALRANSNSLPLRAVLQGIFDPSVEWLLPPGRPSYRPTPLADQEHVLIREYEKLRYFVRGFYDDMDQAKRERLFVQFLERLAPEDAELVAAMKDKKLPFIGITAHQVMRAFPDLIVGDVSGISSDEDDDEDSERADDEGK